MFCVDPGDPTLPILEKLIRDFPQRRIRLLFGSGRDAVNDKVARLTRLVAEAQHDFFVITDSDVRVQPDYLRTIIAPFRDPHVAAQPLAFTLPPRKTISPRDCNPSA